MISGCKRWVRFGMLCVGLATLGGCALTDGQVELDATTTKINARGGRGREVILMPASDSRSDRARCGVKRNTYGIETANVYCTPPPPVWLHQLVARGLREAGFRVVTTKTKRGTDPLFVHLELEHLFVDQIPGWWTVSLVADMHVIVKVGTLSGLSAQRSFFAKGENDVPAVVDAEIQAAVDDAAERLANAVVRAIVRLSDRYPWVGSVRVAELPAGELFALAAGQP